MLKNIFIAMKWNLIIHKDLFLIISEVWINKTLLNRYYEKFICMDDADLLFIFKMFAIDFLFIKNEKKIYVLQKGNIMIIDFFSRYRIIIFTDLIWYEIELFRFPTKSENSLPTRFIHKLWFFSLILDIIMKLTRFLCQSIEFMPWAI